MGTSRAEDAIDGRTARRDRNRLAVLDAVIELFSEENLAPGVHEVAERSGVSLRSVYRYFEDIDALIGAAIERQLELARPLFLIDRIGKGTFEDRIERFVTRRVALFVDVRTVYRASSIRAGQAANVAEGLIASRNSLATQVRLMFEPELSALDTAEAERLGLVLDVLSQFDAIEHLLGDLELEPARIVDHLVTTFQTLLT